jgi:hypothetical protein
MLIHRSNLLPHPPPAEKESRAPSPRHLTTRNASRCSQQRAAEKARRRKSDTARSSRHCSHPSPRKPRRADAIAHFGRRQAATRHHQPTTHRPPKLPVKKELKFIVQGDSIAAVRSTTRLIADPPPYTDTPPAAGSFAEYVRGRQTPVSQTDPLSDHWTDSTDVPDHLFCSQATSRPSTSSLEIADAHVVEVRLCATFDCPTAWALAFAVFLTLIVALLYTVSTTPFFTPPGTLENFPLYRLN